MIVARDQGSVLGRNDPGLQVVGALRDGQVEGGRGPRRPFGARPAERDDLRLARLRL